MIVGDDALGAATEAAAELQGVTTMGAAPVATGTATEAAAELGGVASMWAARVATEASLCLRKTSSLASQETTESDVRLLRMQTHSGQRRPPSEKYER